MSTETIAEFKARHPKAIRAPQEFYDFIVRTYGHDYSAKGENIDDVYVEDGAFHILTSPARDKPNNIQPTSAPEVTPPEERGT